METSYKGACSLRFPVVGARLSRYWEAWERRSVDPWVVSVLRDGYRIPFRGHKLPPLSPTPRDYPSYLGDRVKFSALQAEVTELMEKQAIKEVTPETPGFYNRLFLVPKKEGTWRPVLDVSKLNLFVLKTKFSMETAQTVREAIGRGDWMVSLDMKDAYFHIPVHPQSQRYLRFTFDGRTYQFQALCFGLSTAPQVFTRVIAPISRLMHLAGYRIILYLDDWLILAKSREEMKRAIEFILALVAELGILINHDKSVLDPQQSISYLGMEINSLSFWVSPSEKRWLKALKMFQRCSLLEAMPLRSWLQMLGHMSDLEKFVPGARLRMRPFQFFIRRVWCGESRQMDLSIPFQQI